MCIKHVIKLLKLVFEKYFTDRSTIFYKTKRKISDSVPYTHRKIQKATWQHKNATQNFDYITIADRLRTVSCISNSHPTGLVKVVYGIPTFPLTATAV